MAYLNYADPSKLALTNARNLLISRVKTRAIFDAANQQICIINVYYIMIIVKISKKRILIVQIFYFCCCQIILWQNEMELFDLA